MSEVSVQERVSGSVQAPKRKLRLVELLALQDLQLVEHEPKKETWDRPDQNEQQPR